MASACHSAHFAQGLCKRPLTGAGPDDKSRGYCYADAMVTGETEHAYVCPHCWERSTLLIDLSAPGEQAFVQDCEVCCTPIEFTVIVDNGEITSFSTQAAND